MTIPPKTARSRRTTPTDAERMDQLSLQDVCDVLGISRSTFYEWRAKNLAPATFKLPNGKLRFYKADLYRWLDGLED